MAAYNEEEVIEEKVASILQAKGDLPIEILVGSDCSTDQTNAILERIQRKHPDIFRFYPFQKRQGKPGIINRLFDDAQGDILVLTDANVIFDGETLTRLIRHFAIPEIGLVDTRMINKGMRATGISKQEKAYISREVGIKHDESMLWGSMMGPFGGCFAMRRELYEKVPDNFLVDDFFLNMVVLEKGYLAINEPEALVYEDVSNDLQIEYRRKVRIATGNFQNLIRFSHLLWPPWSSVAFSFLSHKVIRWTGPLLYLLALISVGLLAGQRTGYSIALLALLLIPALSLLDLTLKNLRIHIYFLRFITHFCAMNLAMLVGLLRYIKGVKNNVWQPTKRNQ